MYRVIIKMVDPESGETFWDNCVHEHTSVSAAEKCRRALKKDYVLGPSQDPEHPDWQKPRFLIEKKLAGGWPIEIDRRAAEMGDAA